MHLLVVFCLIAFFKAQIVVHLPETVPSIPFVSKAQVFGFYSILQGSFSRTQWLLTANLTLIPFDLCGQSMLKWKFESL